MNITTSFDDNYIKYAIVMLTSFLINNPGHHTYYVLDHSLGESSKDLIRDSLKNFDVEIIFLNVDFGEIEALLPTTVHWTVDTYGTLLLQDILPDNVDRILYLDADTIVNGSLNDLYSMDFENNRIIASIDSNGSNNPDDYSDIQRQMMGDRISSYFNTGTMLINISGIRAMGNFRIYADAMEKWNYQMTALEQDILNYVHLGHVKTIPWEKYNLFARFAYKDGWDYERVKDSVSIIHFAGVKPWQNSTFHYDIEKIWWEYAERSAVFNDIVMQFLFDLCTDHELENSVHSMINENKEMKILIDKMYGIMQKLGK